MNLFNGDTEKAIDIAKIIKDKYDQSRKYIRDYSGLQAAFTNELYVDGGVVRTRVKVISTNQSKIKRT